MAVGIAIAASRSRIGMVIVSVAGRRVRKMDDTGSRVIQLLPQSKVRISRTKMPSWTYHGWSRPSSRRMASICSWLAICPASICAGSPPNSLKRKKISSTTPARVGTICQSLRKIYAAMLLLLRLSAAILACGLIASPAAADKVLRYAFEVAETGFDPAQVNDLYSSNIIAHIFDPPYRLEYLARPYRVRPNTAVAMPEVSADYKVWTIRIRPGIYFADDPVFKGKKRELTAQDYVYSLKRHWDPKNKSQQLYLGDGRVVGMGPLRKSALAGGKFDYDREVEGVKAIDRYTYRVTFNEPNPNFVYSLASNCNLTCAVAREVIEGYPDRTMEHPVGTNAYRLKEWRRSSRMVLERNPGFREEYYKEEAPADDAEAQAFAARLHGRRLPMIDRVEVYVIEEVQPRWLAFL